MTTIDEILERKKPNRQTIWVPYDNQLAEEYQTAETDWQAAKSFATVRVDDKEAQGRLAEAEEAMNRAKEALREASFRFVFQAVGRKRYEELVTEHPATKEQQRKARELRQDVPEFNEDTFPLALVAASLVEPELDVDDVKRLWESDNFSVAEQRTLFTTAIIVNQQWRVVDLGKE